MRSILIFAIAVCFAPLVQAQGAIENLSGVATNAVNAIRAQHGLAALRADKKLTRASAVHAEDMVKKGFFSHTGSNGSTIGKRARKQRYKFCVISENIAKGQKDLDQVLASWMGSPGHRQNILNAEVTEFALVRGSGDIWVMMLGRSGC